MESISVGGGADGAIAASGGVEVLCTDWISPSIVPGGSGGAGGSDDAGESAAAGEFWDVLSGAEGSTLCAAALPNASVRVVVATKNMTGFAILLYEFIAHALASGPNRVMHYEGFI